MITCAVIAFTTAAPGARATSARRAVSHLHTVPGAPGPVLLTAPLVHDPTAQPVPVGFAALTADPG